MIYVHPDGYRAEATPEGDVVKVLVTRINWPPGRVETFVVPTANDVEGFLVDGFGAGWKRKR